MTLDFTAETRGNRVRLIGYDGATPVAWANYRFTGPEFPHAPTGVEVRSIRVLAGRRCEDFGRELVAELVDRFADYLDFFSYSFNAGDFICGSVVGKNVTGTFGENFLKFITYEHLDPSVQAAYLATALTARNDNGCPVLGEATLTGLGGGTYSGVGRSQGATSLVGEGADALIGVPYFVTSAASNDSTNTLTIPAEGRVAGYLALLGFNNQGGVDAIPDGWDFVSNDFGNGDSGNAYMTVCQRVLDGTEVDIVFNDTDLFRMVQIWSSAERAAIGETDVLGCNLTYPDHSRVVLLETAAWGTGTNVWNIGTEYIMADDLTGSGEAAGSFYTSYPPLSAATLESHRVYATAPIPLNWVMVTGGIALMPLTLWTEYVRSLNPYAWWPLDSTDVDEASPYPSNVAGNNRYGSSGQFGVLYDQQGCPGCGNGKGAYRNGDLTTMDGLSNDDQTELHHLINVTTGASAMASGWTIGFLANAPSAAPSYVEHIIKPRTADSEISVKANYPADEDLSFSWDEFQGGGSSEHVTISGGWPRDDTWHLYMFEYNQPNNELRVWIDGVDVGSIVKTLPSTPWTADDRLHLGGDGTDFSDQPEFYIDEYLFFDKILSSTEHAALAAIAGV